jgi:hypothetical protein
MYSFDEDRYAVSPCISHFVDVMTGAHEMMEGRGSSAVQPLAEFRFHLFIKLRSSVGIWFELIRKLASIKLGMKIYI